jgi:hypothetical protein
MAENMKIGRPANLKQFRYTYEETPAPATVGQEGTLYGGGGYIADLDYDGSIAAVQIEELMVS